MSRRKSRSLLSICLFFRMQYGTTSMMIMVWYLSLYGPRGSSVAFVYGKEVIYGWTHSICIIDDGKVVITSGRGMGINVSWCEEDDVSLSSGLWVILTSHWPEMDMVWSSNIVQFSFLCLPFWKWINVVETLKIISHNRIKWSIEVVNNRDGEPSSESKVWYIVPTLMLRRCLQTLCSSSH